MSEEYNYRISENKLQDFRSIYDSVVTFVSKNLGNDAYEYSLDMGLSKALKEALRKGIEGDVTDIQGIPVFPEESYNHRKNNLAGHFFIHSSKQLEALTSSNVNMTLSIAGERLSKIVKTNYATLNDILKNEVIFGHFEITAPHPSENKIVNILDYILHDYYRDTRTMRKTDYTNDPQMNCKIFINSSRDTIKKISDLKTAIENLNENEMLALEDRYMDSILNVHDELYAMFGNLNEFDIKWDSVKELTAFKAFFEKDSYTVFHENKGWFAFKNGASTKDRFAQSRNLPKIYTKFNSNTVIDKFLDAGYLKIGKEVIEQQIQRIEDMIVKKHGEKILDRKDISNENRDTITKIKNGDNVGQFQRMRALTEHFDSILSKNTQWKQLKAVLIDNSITNYMPTCLRLQFLKNVSKEPLIEETLHSFNEDNLFQKYQNDNKAFFNYFWMQTREEQANILSYFQMRDPKGFNEDGFLKNIATLEER